MRQICYLCHPLGGDVTGNLARALRWLRWARTIYPDQVIIAPWMASVMAGEDDNDPEQRTRGLSDSVAVVRRCDGIMLVGGRTSAGMALERDAAIESGLAVNDLTHLGEEPPGVFSHQGPP